MTASQKQGRSLFRSEDVNSAELARPPASGTEPLSGLTRTSGLVGPAAPAATKFAIGDFINGRYKVDKLIATGGMGCVYLVTDRLFPARPTALKTMRSEANELTLSLFRSEFQTMAGLEHPHVAAVYDFERIAGSDEFLFTMEHLQGKDLRTHVRGGDWQPVARALCEIGQALAYIHNCGLVHLDLKPSNVLVVEPGQTVKVLDFGLSGMRNVRSSIFGTLPYMAPEVLRGDEPDGRSDLYSLGVMAFELLCGYFPHPTELETHEALKFKLEKPVKVGSAERSRLPDWLCDIVEQLAATDPQARFASAHAFVEELNRAMAAIPALRGETQDLPQTRTAYGSTFTGRTAERAALCAFVQKQVEDAARDQAFPQMMWVCGPSGMGKSRLMLEVRRQLQLLDIPFLTGDCYDQDVGEYTALGPVLLGAATLAMAVGQSELIARHGPEIVKMVPGFGREIPHADSLPLSNARAERQRIHNAAADFLLQTSVHVPFALYLNDLQWAAQGTIEFLTNLIERLRAGAGMRLALLGSFRSDELKGRPLAKLFEANPDQGRYARLSLGPLGLLEVEEMASSMLAAQVPRSLVEKLYEGSAGQPLRIEETVRDMIETGELLVRNGHAELAASALEGTLKVDVGAAILRRTQRLGDELRQLLDSLAICARPVEPLILATAVGQELEALQRSLKLLLDRHLVVAVAGEVPRYSLAHDRIRETLYAALSPADRGALYGKAGRAHWQLLTDDDAGELLQVTVGLMNHAPVPDAEKERNALFDLNLRAARAAHGASAFAQALYYLAKADQLLLPARWSEQRERALSLAQQQAETAYAHGDFDDSQRAAQAVIDHAQDLLQEARGWEVWVQCAHIKLNYQAAIDAGVDIANRLGARIPKHPTIPRVLLQALRFKRYLSRQDLDALLQAKETTDPTAQQLIRLMLALLSATAHTRPNLFPFLNFEMTRQSLLHGPGRFGANALLGSGVIFQFFGDFATSQRLAAVAERLLPRTHKDFLGKALFGLHNFLLHWKQPFSVTQAGLRAAAQAAFEVGDIDFGGHSLYASRFADFFTGTPLSEVAQHIRDDQALATQGHEMNRFRVGLSLQVVHCLQQQAPDPLVFEGPFHFEAENLIPTSELSQAACRHFLAAFYRRRLTDAGLLNLQLAAVGGGMQGSVLSAFFHAYSCLVWLHACRHSRSWAKRQQLRWQVWKSLRVLRTYARHAPQHHGHHLILIEAEWRRTQGQPASAVPLYEAAAQQAEQCGLGHEAALIRELLAEVCLELGSRQRARELLGQARQGYSAWGATGKVRDLAARYPDLLDGC